jgi:hypothetical protein
MSVSQNLVMNPSFEDTIQCDYSTNYDICEYWVNPNGMTTDYFCSTANLMDCWGSAYVTPQTYFGFQIAQDGNSFLGLVLYEPNGDISKEYAQGFLSQSLIPNQTYHVAIYVNMADSSNYKTCEIEIAFSDQLIYNSSAGSMNFINRVDFDITDVDSLNWKLLTGAYVANGGEQYIYIGSNTENSNLVCIEELQTGFITTQAAYYFIDNVYVSDIPLSVNYKENATYKVFPNPSTDILNIESKSTFNHVEILDLLGKKIYQQHLNNSTYTIEIDVKEYKKGIYYLIINNEKQKIIIN